MQAQTIGARQAAILAEAKRNKPRTALYITARRAGATLRYDYDRAARALQEHGLVKLHRDGGGVTGRAAWIEVIA